MGRTQGGCVHVVGVAAALQRRARGGAVLVDLCTIHNKTRCAYAHHSGATRALRAWMRNCACAVSVCLCVRAAERAKPHIVPIEVNSLLDERVEVRCRDLLGCRDELATRRLVVAVPASIGPPIVIEEDHHDVRALSGHWLDQTLGVAAIMPVGQLLRLHPLGGREGLGSGGKEQQRHSTRPASPSRRG